MKKILALSLITMLTMPLMANDVRKIGEEFCYDIIDAVSPGSNHVMDCLGFVKKRINKDTTAQQMIMAICHQSPFFAYSFGGMSRKECIEKAGQNGYLSSEHGVVVPQ